MQALQSECERIGSAAAVASLLDVLVEVGGVSLCLDDDERRLEPVVLQEQREGEVLIMDLSSVSHLLPRLQEGEPFVLRGQARGQLVFTPPLRLLEIRRLGERFLCSSAYPDYLDVLQRRESFRAELRLGMSVAASLSSDESGDVQGELRDLSQEGCLLELPLAASALLGSIEPSLDVALVFPNGARFEAQVETRHQRVDPERHLLRVGFRFIALNAEQERQLWYFVCEIEREASRYQKEGGEERTASPLFTAPEPRQGIGDSVGQRDIQHYATPMARRLVKVAAYMNAQLLALQQGECIDAKLLSRSADRLMALHDEDREALLFATRCLGAEPLLVRHGIGVAAHLLDLVGSSVSLDVRKAIVASGLVHDLGKALVPQVVFRAAQFEASERQALHAHVSLLLERLESCQWLSTAIAAAVIGAINERLDGSGYPAGVTGETLNELAKASAVVDVVEAMRRDRADRPARTTQQIYRHLLTHPHQFDPQWIKRYIEHFKALPIGSLARFSSQQLGWVVRLDAKGNPTEVLPTQGTEPPRRDNVAEPVRQVAEKLGRPIGEVAVSA